jgi:F-box/leucine-rich repeat protein 2/20
LRLVDCCEISDKGLIDAAKKLPLLEELNVLFSYFTKDSLEIIGQSCPLLKSLKYSISYRCNEDKLFDEAFSFLKTMPQLRHLEIRSDLMITSDGLLAILDECPLLESLNIEDCGNLHLSRNAWKRCCEQIKNLRLPDEYFWDDDTFLGSLSENSNDDSNSDSENDLDLDDTDECGDDK